MQAANMEIGKLYDFVPVQTKTKPPPSVKSDSPHIKGNSFKDVVKKAYEDRGVQTNGPPENAAGKPKAAVLESNQADQQMGELAALLKEANVTILPFDLEDQQTQQGRQMSEQQTPLIEAQRFDGITVREQATQEKPAPEQNAVRNAEANVPEAQPARNGPAKQETVNHQAQQQTGKPGEAKNGHVIKEQPQAEKQQTGKSGENEVKFTVVKQEETKTEKPEQPIFAKPEIKPPDPEKVYVRVGNGENIDSEKFNKDISGKILTSFSEGRQQIVIELMPQDLGKIIIKLIMQNGKAEIIMQCMNPKTQQMVMMNADAIRNIVEEGTKMPTTLTVKEEVDEYKDPDDNDGQNKRESREGKHTGQLSEDETDIFLHQLRLGLTGDLEAKT